MSLTPSEREETLRFEVSVYEYDELVQTSLFETLGEAEMFAEDWTDRVPGARCDIEDLSHDHTAWEEVERDTALDEDYPSFR